MPKKIKWSACVDCKGEFSYVDVKTQLCVGCESKRDERIKERNKVMAMLGGSRPFLRWRFESFKTNRVNNDAYKVAKSFDFRTENLYLWGPTGVGKSHLTMAVVYDAWESQKLLPQSMWVGKASDLLRQFRAQDGQTEDKLIRHYARMPLLVIDDLGMERITEFGASVLLEIVDKRLTAERNGLVVNSNLKLDALAMKLDDRRLSSRLFDMCKVVDIQDKDHRVEA